MDRTDTDKGQTDEIVNFNDSDTRNSLTSKSIISLECGLKETHK